MLEVTYPNTDNLEPKKSRKIGQRKTMLEVTYPHTEGVLFGKFKIKKLGVKKNCVGGYIPTHREGGRWPDWLLSVNSALST